MSKELYVPPSVEPITVQMIGPTGTPVIVNLHELDSFRRQGYKPVGGGETIKIDDTGTPDPDDAYSRAGNEAFATAKAEGKSDDEAGVIAREAAREAKKPRRAGRRF
jgi:hypothetical protein